MTNNVIEHPGSALLRLSEAGDFTAWRALFGPNAVIWHNTDLTAKPADDFVAALHPVRHSAQSWKYTVIRRADFLGGFLIQFVLNAVLSTGAAVEIAACAICQVDNGLIVRLDEYLDSVPFTTILASAAPQG